METRYCSFCGSRIEPGSGKMFVKRDGSILYFDSSKCEKNFLKLKREPRKVVWTEEGREEKNQRLKYIREVAQVAKAPEPPEEKEEGKEQMEQSKES